MNTVNMGMLSPQEAKLLASVAQGTALFEATTIPISNTGDPPPLWQSWRVGYYLLDSLAGTEILWEAAYGVYGTGEKNPEGTRACLILVVNRLNLPLTLSNMTIFAGEQWVGPSGPDMDPLTGFQTPAVADTVPAADKEGHAGFAVWSLVNAEPNGAVNAGLSFKADPAQFPTGMSLGVVLWNDALQAVSLLAQDDSTAAQNNAWYDPSPGTRIRSLSNETIVNGRTVAVNMNASIQRLDDPNYDLEYLVVVSVSDPNSIPF